jgi:hypothetical protein
MSGNLTVFPGGHLAMQDHFRKNGVQSILAEGYYFFTGIITGIMIIIIIIILQM